MASEDRIVKLIENIVEDYFRGIQTQLTKLKLLTENLQDKINKFEVELSEIRKKLRSL